MVVNSAADQATADVEDAVGAPKLMLLQELSSKELSSSELTLGASVTLLMWLKLVQWLSTPLLIKPRL